jgi:hypothetical protein
MIEIFNVYFLLRKSTKKVSRWVGEGKYEKR